MKVGDLVKHTNSKAFRCLTPGTIIEKRTIVHSGTLPDRIYKVLWSCNTIVTAWGCDMEVISESR